MKLVSWFTRPSNDLSSVLLFGRLKFRIAFSMFLSGYIPSLLIVCPANMMVSPIWSLDFEMVRLMFWHLVRTLWGRGCGVSPVCSLFCRSRSIFGVPLRFRKVLAFFGLRCIAALWLLPPGQRLGCGGALCRVLCLGICWS